MDTYAYIYLIACLITNTVYIGFTSQSIEKRWEKHKHNSKRLNTHLYNAMRKYGIENFKIEVIAMSPDIEYCKNVLEPYYIKKYNSFEDGYNMTLGGEGTVGRNLSDEHKEKISNSTMGRTISEESKEKLRNRTISKEHKEKISKVKAKKWQFMLNGETIEIYNLRKYCIENNLHDTGMIAVYYGKRKSHKGYTICSSKEQ